jgi:hypothetical protein
MSAAPEPSADPRSVLRERLDTAQRSPAATWEIPYAAAGEERLRAAWWRERRFRERSEKSRCASSSESLSRFVP